MTAVHLAIFITLFAAPWFFFFGWCVSLGRLDGDGRYAWIRDALLSLSGFAGTSMACFHTDGSLALCLSCSILTAGMLMASARTDMATGNFYVVPLAVCLMGNGMLALLSGGFREAKGAFAVPLWKEVAAVFVILFVLWIGRLAWGDCMIYAACWLSFLTLFRDHSFLAFFLMLLVSTVLGVITWILRVIRGKDPKARFPYTTQIALGCMVSYVVFGLWR